MDPLTATGVGDVTAGTGVIQLVLQADPIVKMVMLVLLAASVWCWAVILDKGIRLARLTRKADRFEATFWSGTSLDELYRRLAKRPDHPMALVFTNAMAEWKEAPPTLDPETQRNLLARVERVMALTIDRELTALGRSLQSLATIGSTAPFVGLFGTVWGIMNSFQSIAVTKNTTLAVVAPGIAEALLATAMGLAAAIPAVVAYNRLADSLDRYEARLSTFADELAVVLGREADGLRVA
ncbi:Biopolymer transport protein ExbB [bacterium HR40]|nr:Biopolymer transport protein ExbB [bacterium HR40]